MAFTSLLGAVMIISTVNAHGGESSGDALVSWGHSAHAVCMLSATCLALTGVLCAVIADRRTSLSTGYFKQGSNHYLYVLHRGALGAVIPVTLAGIGFAYLGTAQHMANFHSVPGAIIVMLLIMQAILGFCLPLDPIVRRVHRMGGRLLLSGMLAQLVTGWIRMGWPAYGALILAGVLLVVPVASAFPQTSLTTDDQEEPRVGVELK